MPCYNQGRGINSADTEDATTGREKHRAGIIRECKTGRKHRVNAGMITHGETTLKAKTWDKNYQRKAGN